MEGLPVKALNIHETKTRLSSILFEVESGQKFLICRHGKPVAELSPLKKRNRLRVHPILRKITLNYDPTEPLNENEWPGVS
jgi:antitoxin (DNA-binding transcriptional repressor) of toxin-antitoxin stability system